MELLHFSSLTITREMHLIKPLSDFNKFIYYLYITIIIIAK